MKKIILLMFLSISATAQNHNSVWVFGDSAGINFNGGAVPIVSGMDSRGSCVSHSDSSGNLILYAATMPYYGPYTFNATKIFNSQHQMIIGADSITGESWYSELGLFPKPGDSTNNLFCVFSIGLNGAPHTGMYNTLIDMSLNSGLGGLLQENIQLDNNSYGDCLTTIKHGNGRDWWVIAKWSTFSMVLTNRFFMYLVTPDTIIGPITQDLGNAMDYDLQKMIWHPRESKFMLINVTGFMGEYDFDRCTGTITLNRIIFPDQSTGLSRAFWGGAYSSDGNVFYTSRTSYGGNSGDYNYLLQYDLTSADIPASCDTLDSTMYPPVDCGDLRLAPDGKIYYSQAYISATVLSYPYADSMRNNINEYLGVINNPDLVGNGCNFLPFSFYLGGKRTYYGLPNNPNYSLGALAGSQCDTVLSIGVIEQEEKSAVIKIAPNPATKVVFFNAQRIKGKNATLQIINAMGEKVFEKAVPVYGGCATQTIDVSGFSSGIYFVALRTEKEVLSKKFVKE